MASWIASFLPITAPFVMPARTTMGEVTGVETAIAIAVMVAATYGLVRAAGRIYEGAILRTGGRVTYRDAWRTAA